MANTASAPGKIILSGEYAVLFGKQGLAIPAPLRVAVRYSAEPRDNLVIDWEGPADWQAYIQDIVAHCHVDHGTLRMNNDLPLGKGMGSSTAFLIAICRCLLGKDCHDQALKIEDALNPGHSGLDFAVIWHEQPTLYRKGTEPQLADIPLELPGAVLIDTGAPGEQTPELVAWVKDHEAELIKPLETIGHCTEQIMAGADIREIIPIHHQAQVALGVVPEPVQTLIKKIEQKGGVAKVIGAGSRTGSAGMVLAVDITPDDSPEFPTLSL